MSGKYLPQETEEALNDKAGIGVITIDHSGNMSILTGTYLPDMENSTIASPIILIAPSAESSHNTLPTTPHTLEV